MTKSFEKWDIDDVERTFGIRAKATLPLLEEWCSARHEIRPEEEYTITILREDLQLNVDLWNEDELKFKFIAPLISLIRYNTERFRAFTQRTLSATLNGVKINGRVDFVIATGKANPLQPFFFLHEYKKARGSDNDPLAQLLVEMLAARELNAIKYPLYGCYVVGRAWYFVVLEGDFYAETAPYLATGDGLLAIFSILREAKFIITRLAAEFGQ